MNEIIRKLSSLLDEIPADIQISTVSDRGTIQVHDGIKRLGEIFKTKVITVERDSQLYPYQLETVIEDLTFYELIEDVTKSSGLQPMTSKSTKAGDLAKELFDLLLSRNETICSTKIRYSKEKKYLRIFVTVEYDGRDDRVIYDRTLYETDIIRITSAEPKSFTTKLGKLLIQLTMLYPYKESITLRRQNAEVEEE